MRQRQQRAAARVSDQAAEIVKVLRSLHSRSGHNLHRLWADWVASMALAIANSVDRRPDVHAAREAEYMRLVEIHGPEVMDAYGRMLWLLTVGLELAPHDLLGAVYMALELGNDGAGQFFTPYDVCRAMAQMTFEGSQLRDIIERTGFVTVSEPAVGGGAMLIALVEIMLELELNPSQHMHVIAVDVDRSVLMMAYVQLSLLGVPAICVVGNSLTLEEREHWYTPVHVMGGWSWKLQARRMLERVHALFDEVDQSADRDLNPENEAAEPPPLPAPGPPPAPSAPPLPVFEEEKPAEVIPPRAPKQQSLFDFDLGG